MKSVMEEHEPEKGVEGGLFQYSQKANIRNPQDLVLFIQQKLTE